MFELIHDSAGQNLTSETNISLLICLWQSFDPIFSSNLDEYLLHYLPLYSALGYSRLKNLKHH